MDITLPILQDILLTKLVLSSGDRIDLGEEYARY